MQLNQVTLNQVPVYFGYGIAVHEEIRNGAFKRIQNPELQAYLYQNACPIGQVDDEEDWFNPGLHHFFKVQLHPATPTYNNVFAADASPLFKIEDVFETYHRSNYPDANWQLTEQNMPQGTSSYSNLIKSINKLIHDFRQGSRQEINQDIGVISHAVGDAHHVLHDILETDWPLIGANWSPGEDLRIPQTHFITDTVFCEPVEEIPSGWVPYLQARTGGEIPSGWEAYLMTDAGKQRLEGYRSSFAKPAAQLEENNLKEYLLDFFQTTFLKIFDVAEVHQSLMADKTRWTVSNLKALESKFREGVEPIFAERIFAAQEALATILDWAWNQAKKDQGTASSDAMATLA